MLCLRLEVYQLVLVQQIQNIIQLTLSYFSYFGIITIHSVHWQKANSPFSLNIGGIFNQFHCDLHLWWSCKLLRGKHSALIFFQEKNVAIGRELISWNIFFWDIKIFLMLKTVYKIWRSFTITNLREMEIIIWFQSEFGGGGIFVNIQWTLFKSKLHVNEGIKGLFSIK